MGGAYTSKPEEEISYPAPPDIPVNWNPEWPFPGPNPPGYAPVSPQVVLVAPASVRAEDGGSYSAVSVTGQWQDYLGGPAGLPVGTTTQFWTAEIDGNELPLKLESDSAFSRYLELEYSNVSRYYQVSESICFQINEADDGRVITLRAYSLDAEGNEIEDTQELTVTISGNYMQVSVDSSYWPSEFTNTMAITIGSNSISSTDGTDDQVTIETDELETLVGQSFTGSLVGTNYNDEWPNGITGNVSAYLFDRDGLLLSSVYIEYSVILEAGSSDEETKAAFKVTDIDTLTALN